VSTDLFSFEEIAQVAGVPVERVEALVDEGRVIAFRRFIAPKDAVALVRRFAGRGTDPGDDRSPVTLLRAPRRSAGRPLVAAALLHVALLALATMIASLGWLQSRDTEGLLDRETPPVRLVYLMTPGPGGGGGGGGLRMPTPPPAAQRRAPTPVPRRAASPVPPPRPRPAPVTRPDPVVAPPIVLEPPKVEPRVDPPPPAPPVPAPAIQAPVAPMPTSATDVAGLVTSRPAPPSTSAGSGTGGGVGSGAGTGNGEGQGAGLGPGTGGGTGGGVYRPGSGISPPTLVREVRPAYTDEGRRRAVEGDVVLEIVVRRDGTVGNVRVLRALGAGLDQRAADAVRQWRFGPAMRAGAPVDVVVEVSVEFKLR
jgi:periplasmic protein TonB